MSRKRLFRGIKRITIFVMVVGLFMTFGVFSGINKRIINSIKYPEFRSSMAAYHTIYGNDNNRIQHLDSIAKSMGYKDLNDYRIKTW